MLLWCAGSLEWYKAMLQCNLLETIFMYDLIIRCRIECLCQVIAEVLPSQGLSQEVQSEGSETSLAATLHFYTVHCEDSLDSQAESSIKGRHHGGCTWQHLCWQWWWRWQCYV